jgi:hypothetical protein
VGVLTPGMSGGMLARRGEYFELDVVLCEPGQLAKRKVNFTSLKALAGVIPDGPNGRAFLARLA